MGKAYRLWLVVTGAFGCWIPIEIPGVHVPCMFKSCRSWCASVCVCVCVCRLEGLGFGPKLHDQLARAVTCIS